MHPAPLPPRQPGPRAPQCRTEGLRPFPRAPRTPLPQPRDAGVGRGGPRTEVGAALPGPGARLGARGAGTQSRPPPAGARPAAPPAGRLRSPPRRAGPAWLPVPSRRAPRPAQGAQVCWAYAGLTLLTPCPARPRRRRRRCCPGSGLGDPAPPDPRRGRGLAAWRLRLGTRLARRVAHWTCTSRLSTAAEAPLLL